MGRNKETMKRVLKFISPYKAKIIIMLLTALVTVGFTLYTPILIGNGVDNIVGPGNVNVAGLLKTTSQAFHQTLIMITHNLELAQLADQVIRIEDGCIKG